MKRQQQAQKQQVVRISYEPRPWQATCEGLLERFVVIAVHRRAGKTEHALMKLLRAALQCSRDLGVFIYLAPLLKQAENIVWARLKRVVAPLVMAGAIEIRESDLQIVFKHNHASIRLFGANNPDELRGMGIDGIVIDEVAQIAPGVWDEIVRPALSDRQGWALFIGTPHGINLFSELYMKAASRPDWKALRFTVYDTGVIPPDEVAQLAGGGMTENAFAREYLCDFSAAGDEQLMSLRDVELAAQRSYQLRDVQKAPRVLGVDPARFGNDRSVIVRRQGLVIFPPYAFRGLDNMALASRVAVQIRDWQPHAVFIDAGAGAGVIDRLRQLGFNPIEVPFGGRANAGSLYSNRRTEMWWEMREWLMAGGSIPNDPTFKTELATPIYTYDAQGRRVLESKDDIKKRLPDHGSPDCADAACLTFAAPVATGDAEERSFAAAAATDEPYDPIAAYEQERRSAGEAAGEDRSGRQD